MELAVSLLNTVLPWLTQLAGNAICPSLIVALTPDILTETTKTVTVALLANTFPFPSLFIANNTSPLAELPWVMDGLGVAVVSTPRGVMTAAKARRLGLGGEIWCYIW